MDNASTPITTAQPAAGSDVMDREGTGKGQTGGPTCAVRSLRLIPHDADPDRAVVYDFGQRRCGSWPTKIGKHPLRSERQLPPLYPAFTADERRQDYERFLRYWAEQPWSLGAHWFQHADQNATGRPLDGENQTVGFVDIVDRPHPDLVAAAMAATRVMYPLHAQAQV